MQILATSIKRLPPQEQKTVLISKIDGQTLLEMGKPDSSGLHVL